MYKLHLILKYLRKRRIAWVSLLAVAGFIGGFVTLVARMDGGSDDEPGNGAVV